MGIILNNVFLRVTAAFSLILAVNTSSHSQSINEKLSSEQVYEKISGSIAYILSYDDYEDITSQGSGVVVDSTGIIWTNYHLFDGDSRFKLIIDGTTYHNPKIIGADPDKDILILKLDETFRKFITPVSSADVKKGSTVYAYGNPFSIQNTFSDGVLSNIHKFSHSDQIFLQYTASISGGSSGGALVNDRGYLIGITSASINKSGVQNLNFAVQSDDFFNTPIIDPSNSKHISELEKLCLGYYYYDISNYTSAIRLFDSYLSVFPEDSYTFFKRGMCYSNTYNNTKAIEDFTEAIRLNGHTAIFYRERGNAYMEDSNYIDAVRDLEKSILMNNSDPYAYWNLAYLQSEYLGYYDASINNCNLSISLNFNDPYSHYLKGNVLLKKGDTLDAMICYYNSTYADSTYANAHEKLAYLSFARKEFSDAVFHFTKLINNSSESTHEKELFYKRGMSYKNSGKVNKAVEDIKEALSMDYYENNDYLASLGYCYIDSKDYYLAKNEFSKVLSKNKKHFETLVGMAIVSFKEGNFDEAEDFMSKAVYQNSQLKKGIPEIEKINNKSNNRLNFDQLAVVYELLNRLGYNVSPGSYFGNSKTAIPAE